MGDVRHERTLIFIKPDGVQRGLVGEVLRRVVRAAPVTIRGDFSIDSPTVANLQRRPVRNMIHASGTVDEAEFEIKMWFRPGELFAYRRGGGAPPPGGETPPPPRQEA